MSPRHPHGTPEPASTPPAPAVPAPRPASGAEAGPLAGRLAYSVEEAARLTGLSRDLLYDQMRRGHLHYIKVGRRRLITRRHLEEFLNTPTRPAPPGAAGAAGRAGS